jgi:hypothetical protein
MANEFIARRGIISSGSITLLTGSIQTPGIVSASSIIANSIEITGTETNINIFGDNPSDQHIFTGSILLSGSQQITGSLVATNTVTATSFTGSLFGTSSYANNATSASFAPTILPAGIVSSSTQINTGSFSGSFTGTLIGTSSWASNAISASVSLRSAVQSTGSAPSTPINNELWYDNNTGKTYIYYVSGSVGQWVLQSDPTYDPGPSLQNLQDVTDLGSITNNVITITNTTPSTSTTTGALKVSGGVGVSGSIYAEKLTATQISGSIVSASAYIGQKSSVIYVIDGGGLTIQTGIKGDLYIPFDCTVTEWVLLTDQVGSIVIDVWSDIYGSYPPTITDSIAGTDLPTLSGVNKNKSTALTGWNQNISAGSTLRFNVNSVSSVTRVTLTLNVTKT